MNLKDRLTRYKSLEKYQAFFNVARHGIHYYLATWRQSVLLIIAFSLIHGLLTHWLPLPKIWWVSLLSYILVWFAGIFLLGAAFYRAEGVIANKPVTYLASFLQIKQRFLVLIMATIIIGIIVGIFMYIAVSGIQHLVTNTQSIIYFLFVTAVLGCLVIVVLLYCYYVIPLLIVTHLSLAQAFAYSAHFVKSDWQSTFLLYGISIAIVYLLAPFTNHSLWLHQHYLLDLFELLVLTSLLPWLMNMILVTLIDIQKKMAERK